jgi:hypothetical protein
MSDSLTCQMCGADFGGRSDAVYCSSACRQKAHRARTARRIAELEWRPGRRRALVKPDVAGTIARARVEQRRAHELSRITAGILAASAESQAQLKSVVWLRQARAAAAEPRGSRDDDMDPATRRLG